MKKIRNCKSGALNTGTSKCPLDFKQIKYALIMAHGQKLPEQLTAQTFEKLCHDDLPARVCPVGEFVDYAKEGGEVQTSNVGYGPTAPNGVSAQKDTLTLGKSDDALRASLLRGMNEPRDVYFVDGDNIIYGYDDGTDILAGIPMSSVYPDGAVFSGAEKAPMTVNFCYADIRDALEHINFMQLDFDISSVAMGLVGVILKEVSTGQYKIIEEIGGLDRTEEFGQAIQTGASTCVLNGSTVTYKSGQIAITSDSTPTLAAPSVLYAAEVKGIYYVRTEKTK